jgi:uncharacterized membrane-anchored protein
MNRPIAFSMRTALLIVATLQSLVLGWMVWDRVSLLANGREIKAAVVPIDPRDLFRGDYVTLGSGFSTGAEVALPDGARQGDTVYALLKNQSAAEWSLSSLSAAEPVVASDGEVVLKGIVEYVRPGPQPGPGTIGRLRYGIERFYVPEGTGRDLEVQVREKRVVAVLAVGRDGKVALKGLEADGRRIVEEPLL